MLSLSSFVYLCLWFDVVLCTYTSIQLIILINKMRVHLSSIYCTPVCHSSCHSPPTSRLRLCLPRCRHCDCVSHAQLVCLFSLYCLENCSFFVFVLVFGDLFIDGAHLESKLQSQRTCFVKKKGWINKNISWMWCNNVTQHSWLTSSSCLAIHV